MVRRRLRWLVLGALLVVLAGCKTEAFIEVQVDDDGGGSVYVAVALDAEAAARSVNYEASLPIEDLKATGWTVTGPAQEADGRIWLRAQKPFSQVSQLPGLIDEVAGKGGPLRDFKVDTTSSFGKRGWAFSGTVDLSGGLTSFTDPELAAALGGTPLGQSPEKYAEALGGATLESLVKLNIVVDLPGEVQESNGNVGKAGLAAPTTTSTAPGTGSTTTTPAAAAGSSTTARRASTGAAIVWTPSFADGAPSELRASASADRLLPRLWRWLALVAAALGAVALLYQLVRLGLDRAREGRRVAPRASRPASVTEPVPVPVGGPGVGSTLPGDGLFAQSSTSPTSPLGPSSRSGSPGADPGGGLGTVVVAPVGSPTPPPSTARADSGEGEAASGSRAKSLRLIVIETTGALFAARDPVGDVLVPFARERGCVLSVRQIADVYLARAVGGMSAVDFWTGLGLTGDPMLLDDVYARRFELTDDVLTFLSQARQRGVSVAAVGDDVPEWTAVFRQRFRLDGMISAWVSSAEVGVRVPHPALLEAVERATGYPPAASMVIAGTRALLDTARRLGFRTIQYNPGPDDPESDHPVLRTFADRGRANDPSPAT